MKIAIAQINTTIGDFTGNAAKILDRVERAGKEGADLVVFPELSICGYPPRDLLEKPDFVQQALNTLSDIAEKTGEVAVVVGCVRINEKPVGRELHNSAALLYRGKIRLIQHKTLLPEYDVFDEARHFEPAREYNICNLHGSKIGLSMCEDIWSFFEFGGRRFYKVDPIEEVVKAGAKVVINISASPFTIGKHRIRRELVSSAASRVKRPIVYCNLVGGNDELVFDGRSFVVDGKGNLIREAACFEEDSFVIDIDDMKPVAIPPAPCDEKEVCGALVLGLRDYMRKCAFEKVVIGLSGGIDSAVVAAIACEAVGPGKVMGVMMSSPYTSPKSVADAELLAKNLGMVTYMVPISDIYEAFRKTMGCNSGSKDVTVTEENIQARVRGTILMAISNREGALVLSTGNKSELSVGYCTLYGDMAGGFALISDIPKTMVYALALHLNDGREVIPRSVLLKPPSAELRPSQKDQDSLPPYDVLDPIIRAYVEDRMSVDKIVAMGFDRATVKRVTSMIDHNEYKRRQAAPGIKITSKAFGLGRRFPIAWKP